MTPCFLDGNDGLGNNRLERNLRYLKYYRELKNDLGFDKIIMIDNASSVENVRKLSQEANGDGMILRHSNSLTGGRFPYDYPYCWRALYTMQSLVHDFGFDKIITIDSDCFVLTERLAKHIQETETGWSSVWCKRWGFPEAAFHIFCPDAHMILNEYVKIPMEVRNGTIMEWSIPFTHIHREFNCDRFGEEKIPQDASMDYYGQASLDIPLTFCRNKATKSE